MNASKENARKAHAWMKDILNRSKWPCQQAHIVEEGQQFIEEFLLASERKLPSEAAYKRDKARRKATA